MFLHDVRSLGNSASSDTRLDPRQQKSRDTWRDDNAASSWAAVERLVAAPSRVAIAKIFGRLLRECGYDTVVFALAQTTGAVGGVEQEPAILLDTRPAEWIAAYDRRRCSATDPFVLEGCRRIDPISWREVLDARPCGQVAPAVVLAHEFGMRDGLIVPVITDDRHRGLVIASARVVDSRAEVRQRLTAAAIVAFHRLLALRRASSPSTVGLLSNREAEVLHWIMVGKSDWDIGQILEISAKTVNFHVENVKRKFGVATRIQAVVAALKREVGPKAMSDGARCA